MEFKTIGELRKVLMKAKTTDKFGAGILTMILSEALGVAKSDGNREPSDEDVSYAVKRIIKMAEQSLASGVKGAKEELDYLQQFAPKMISEEQTKTIVSSKINILGLNMGMIMKELKAEYGDTMDMKLAGSIIKDSIK
jgi:hypothetical protein